MDKYEVRRLRLIDLMHEKCSGKVSELAKTIERSDSYVSRLMYPEGKPGKKRIGEDMAEIITRAFNLPPYWLDGEDEESPSPTDEFFEIIPQLDLEASCGNGKFTDYVVVKGGLSFKRETLREWGITPKNGRIIYASGQSMEPTIGHGRVVLINLDDTTPQDGRVFLICDADSAMLLKRLVREFDPTTGGMVWKMRSDNPDKRQYADKPLPDHSTASIVGRAVWHDGIL